MRLKHILSCICFMFLSTTVSANEYRSYVGITNVLNALEGNHPNIVKTKIIGYSIEGRAIIAVKISDSPGTEDPLENDVLFVGGTHAREWISIEVPLRLAEYLANNYSSNSEVKALIDNREIWIVPCLNPDGFVYSETDRYWRKNRRNQTLSPFFGVDLNRNFGFHWGEVLSDRIPFSETYRGDSAFSEPCTQAIKNLVEAYENKQNVMGGAPQFSVILSYHAYGQDILYPWGYTIDPPPDVEKLKLVAENLQSLIQNVHGTLYDVKQSGTLYGKARVSGDLTDWAYGEQGIPAFTIELRPGSAPENAYQGFSLPLDQIIPTFEENLPAALYLAGMNKTRVMGFEDGADRQPIRSNIPGLKFTTTQGYNWIYGDWRTGNYNGPYPSGSFTSSGNIFAWLGENQGTGRIDFIGSTAKSLTLWTSTYSGLTMDAYDSNNNWLASSGWVTNNVNTGTMSALTVSAEKMSYILVHDSGNYWIVDDLEVEDILAESIIAIPGKFSRNVEVTDTYNTGDTKTINFQNPISQDLNIVFSWAGSEFRVKAISPFGAVAGEIQSDTPPIKLLIPNAVAGSWYFEITAIDATVNEPTAFVLGTYNSNDLDNDGVANTNDNCPNENNADQSDVDGDGVGDRCDNCPNLANPLQEDLYPLYGVEGSGNGIGDLCEEVPDDLDEDGIKDTADNCRTLYNPEQKDMDGDGVGDACDLQTCGNGSLENQEECDDGNLSNGDGCSSSCRIDDVPGDLDGDGDIDRNDVNIISFYRNKPASAYPKCDIDGDGTITILDMRTLMGMCTYPKCAVK